jgi:hypothetical protein
VARDAARASWSLLPERMIRREEPRMVFLAHDFLSRSNGRHFTGGILDA